MRSRTFILHFPLLLLLLLLFSSCELGQGEGTLEALEQNYRQIRSVNRDAEIITADFVRNLNDSLAVRLADTLANTEEDFAQYNTLQNGLDSISLHTYQILDIIDPHLKMMEKMAIKNPETGRFEAIGEDDISHKYWQDQNRIAEIKQSLLEFEAALIHHTGNTEIQVDANHDDNFWLQFSNKRPIVAYLALLEGLKATIHSHQRQALQLLYGSFGTPYFRSDNLMVINQPEGQVIAAGMPFKSQVHIGLASTRTKSNFEGTGLTVNPDSVSASIELGADGALIPEGKYTGTQFYIATIQVPRSDGSFVNLDLADSFTVVRPTVSVLSAGSQVLYRNCENVLSIDVPALENTFQPKISATRARIKVLEDTVNLFQIVPTGDTCLITVNSQLGDSSILIDNINYNVIEPPKPSVELWVNDQLHNGFSLIPRTSRLLLKIIPDPEFMAAYPNDARYGFTTVDVMIQRDMGAPDVVKTVNGRTREAIKGITIDLGPQVEQAFPGTTIYLRINDIFRKNFAGKNLSEKRFTESEMIIGLVVR